MNMFLNLNFLQIRFFYDCELLCQLQVLALFTNLTDLRSEIKSIRNDGLFFWPVFLAFLFACFFGLFFNVLSFVSLFPGCLTKNRNLPLPPRLNGGDYNKDPLRPLIENIGLLKLIFP